MAESKLVRAYKLVSEYKGNNPLIQFYKRQNESSKLLLTEDSFTTDYILKNYDYNVRDLNKTVLISEIYGKILKEKHSLEFIPKKLRITKIIGEMGASYHCYGQFRQSVPPQLMYVGKKYILTPLDTVEWENLDIDFDKFDKITEKYNRKLKEHQKTAVKFLVANKRCILADSMGLGKALENNIQLPTIDGYKKIGDIKVGDIVFDSRGKQTKVIGVYPQGVKDLYEIEFTDETKTICCEEHLWFVKDKTTFQRGGNWKILTTKQIIDRGLEYKNNIKSTCKHNYKFRIPICGPVEYQEKKHFINPYLMGVMIGDGYLKRGVYISISNTDIEILHKIEKMLNNEYCFTANYLTFCPIYNIVRKKEFRKNNNTNEYTKEIKRLGLNLTSNYKFIPEEYKFDSIKNRIELLRGLMDTDGYITEKNNKISYSTSSHQLANDVKEIVESLGGLANVHSYDRKDKKHKTEYVVSIKIEICPFSLKRKAERYTITKGKPKYLVKSIKDIKYSHKGEATCIKVDSKDESFLCNDYIVTHNTTSAIVAALASERRKILIITTASLKSTWKREIGFYEPEENICVINGSTWDGETSKFTVINYDIVQRYYEVPMEPKYTYEEIDNGGKIEKVKVPVMTTDKKTGKLVPKMTKSRKKKDIIEALNNSPLFLSKFDCVIIDEAQKLSNNTSIRYNVISDFLSKSNIEYVFLTTGTPLTNTPINLFHILKLIDAPITSDYNYFVQRYCDGKTMMKPGEWNKWSTIYYRNGNFSQKLGDFVKEHAKTMIIPQGSSNLDELKEAIKHLYIRRLSSDIPGMVNKFLDTRVYKLTDRQKEKYDSLWDDYVRAQEENGDNTNEDYRQLVEGTLVRQFLANEMVENTIKLCNDYIEDDEKVVIVCNFISEIEKFKEYYGKKCVVYDGKMTTKQKDKSEHEFMTNPKIKVFIGQIESAGVGLTLTESRIMIFNSYSWLETSNRQMQDRIYRITQTRDALCIYQLFDDSISRDMFEKVMRKGLVMDTTIKAEKDK